jgi:hypothetical protein
MPDQIPVEDIQAIQDLLGRYCWYVDENRGEEWASLYTEDGVFEGTRPQPVCGHDALTQVPTGIAQQFEGRMRHQWSNLYLERGDDDHVIVARFYNQVGIWRDGYKPVMLARSTATLVRAGISMPWRIQRNTIVPLT